MVYDETVFHNHRRWIMKNAYGLIAGGVAALLLSLSAQAQPGPGGGMAGMGGMAGTTKAVDCSKAGNPQHCEERQKAMEICKDQRGTARQQCVEDNLPPPDCSKARNPDRCATVQAARAACKGKYGAERKTCQRAQKPAPVKRGPRQGGMGGGMGGMGPGMGGMPPTRP